MARPAVGGLGKEALFVPGDGQGGHTLAILTDTIILNITVRKGADKAQALPLVKAIAQKALPRV